MKRRMFVASFALAVLTVVGLAGSVTAGEQVHFQGTLEGTFTRTPTADPLIFEVDLVGWGQATQLGQYALEFPHQVDFGMLPPKGIGTYTFTAASGETLIAGGIGYSTPVAPGIVLVVEEGIIVDGTGRFANASGEFTVTRLVYQFTGTTIGSLEGTISSPSASNP